MAEDKSVDAENPARSQDRRHDSLSIMDFTLSDQPPGVDVAQNALMAEISVHRQFCLGVQYGHLGTGEDDHPVAITREVETPRTEWFYVGTADPTYGLRVQDDYTNGTPQVSIWEGPTQRHSAPGKSPSHRWRRFSGPRTLFPASCGPICHLSILLSDFVFRTQVPSTIFLSQNRSEPPAGHNARLAKSLTD